MFTKITLVSLIMTLLGFMSCSGVDEVKNKTRRISSGASTVDSSISDLENTESTYKRIKDRMERR